MNYRGRSRGLAFMIFATHEDALSAYEAGRLGITVCNRKLVVEVFKPLETLNMERKAKKKLIEKQQKKVTVKDSDKGHTKTRERSRR